MRYIVSLCFALTIVLLSDVVSLFSIPGGNFPKYPKEEFPYSCSEEATDSLRAVRPVDDCPNCKRSEAEYLSNEDVTKLRFDLLKSQLLQKLQLDKAPCPTAPKPPAKYLMNVEQVKRGTDILEDEGEISETSESVVLFTNNNEFTCTESKMNPCSLFEFRLPVEVDLRNFLYSELWVYQTNRTWPHSIRIADPKNSTEVWEKSPLPEYDESSSLGWTKFVLNISHFMAYLKDELMVSIEVYGAPVEERDDEVPFLIIYTKTENKKVYPRGRRSVDCVEGSTSCCRQTHYLSFADIGWDNWILKPDGFSANYCKGKCLADFSSFLYLYSAVLHTYIKLNQTVAASLGLSVCCTPSELSPLSIIYRVTNGTIYHKSVPNMIVTSCGCA